MEKYGTKKEHRWVKAHILTGTKTNIIASARITEGNANDSPYFEPMVEEAHENGFNIEEVEADKAYCSRANYDLVDEIGATAYIPFKSNATGRSGGFRVWNKMYHYFMNEPGRVYGALPQEKQCRNHVYDGKDEIRG